jgi:hypothetical protein
MLMYTDIAVIVTIIKNNKQRHNSAFRVTPVVVSNKNHCSFLVSIIKKAWRWPQNCRTHDCRWMIDVIPFPESSACEKPMNDCGLWQNWCNAYTLLWIVTRQLLYVD